MNHEIEKVEEKNPPKLFTEAFIIHMPNDFLMKIMGLAIKYLKGLLKKYRKLAQ